MAALKTGNGFSAPVEATPLDAADEVTFAPNVALTAKVETELKTTQSDLPLVVNDYVTGFINYYSNSPGGHATLKRALERAGKYKDMIQKNLRDAGMPQDLIYLGVAESGFQPQALNAKSGAGGMWQFMSVSGRLRPHAQWLRRRAIRSGEIVDCLREVHEVALQPVRRLVPRHGGRLTGARATYSAP